MSHSEIGHIENCSQKSHFEIDHLENDPFRKRSFRDRTCHLKTDEKDHFENGSLRK